MTKIIEPTPDYIDKIDRFNSFMLEKGIFIMKEGMIYHNPEPVMNGQYEYTMLDALRDFKNLQ